MTAHWADQHPHANALQAGSSYAENGWWLRCICDYNMGTTSSVSFTSITGERMLKNGNVLKAYLECMVLFLCYNVLQSSHQSLMQILQHLMRQQKTSRRTERLQMKNVQKVVFHGPLLPSHQKWAENGWCGRWWQTWKQRPLEKPTLKRKLLGSVNQRTRAKKKGLQGQ